MSEVDITDKISEQGETTAEDDEHENGTAEDDEHKNGTVENGEQGGSEYVTHTDDEGSDSITELDKPCSSVTVTRTDDELKESIAEDGKQRAIIAVTDDTQPASIVVTSNATADCPSTSKAVPFTQRIADVHGSTSQPKSGRESANSRLGPTKQVPASSPFPSLVNSIRNSAVSAMKRTRQTLSEKLGRGTKTVDVELETRIESLRLIQNRYSSLMQLTRSFNAHFGALVNCQQSLAAEFGNLSQKMPELHDEFAYNAETQRALFKNGETLIGTLNFFISTVNTLCFKTIEDTLDTVKLYEAARLEFDAYRSDYESNGASMSSELQQSYEQHRLKFEQLRQVLDIKLNFLDENKIKVMQQQLVLFHNAIAAYFAGNQTALDETVKQFNIKLKSPNGGIPSWLENQD